MQRLLKHAKQSFWRWGARVLDRALLACCRMRIAWNLSRRSYTHGPGRPLLIVPELIEDDGQTCSYLVVSAKVVEITAPEISPIVGRSRYRARRGLGY